MMMAMVIIIISLIVGAGRMRGKLGQSKAESGWVSACLAFPHLFPFPPTPAAFSP